MEGRILRNFGGQCGKSYVNTAATGRTFQSSPLIRQLRAPRTKRVIIPSAKPCETQKDKISTLSFRDFDSVEEDDDQSTLQTHVKLVTELNTTIEHPSVTVQKALAELSELKRSSRR